MEQAPTIVGMKKQCEAGGRLCFTKETEVLTNRGWKRIDTIDNTDKVLTYDPTTNTLVYDFPNMVINEVSEQLIHVNTPQIEFTVTGNHRIYQATQTSRQYTFITANQLAGLERIPGSKQNKFRIPKYFVDCKRQIQNTQLPDIIYTKSIKHG